MRVNIDVLEGIVGRASSLRPSPQTLDAHEKRASVIAVDTRATEPALKVEHNAIVQEALTNRNVHFPPTSCHPATRTSSLEAASGSPCGRTTAFRLLHPKAAFQDTTPKRTLQVRGVARSQFLHLITIADEMRISPQIEICLFFGGVLPTV